MKKQIKGIQIKRLLQSGKALLVQELEYSKEGNLLEVCDYGDNNNLLSTTEYGYADGKLSWEKTTNEYGDWHQMKYSYNEQGELSLTETIYQDGSSEQEIRTKRDSQEIVRRIDSEGGEDSRDISFFDDQKLLVKKEFYEQGELIQVQKIKYDGLHRMIESHVIFHETEVEYFEFTRYDHLGNIMEEREETEEGQVNWSRKYEYDQKKIKRIEQQGNGSHFIEEYEYDQAGRLIKQSVRGSNGALQNKMNFEFNQYGDQVKAISIGNGDFDGLMQVQIRDIEYF